MSSSRGASAAAAWVGGLVLAALLACAHQQEPERVLGDVVPLPPPLRDVPDRSNGCPSTPGDAPDGCPPRDIDSDGVVDRQDRCPDLAGAGADGCPIPDLDDDGVPDPQDRCLKAAEIANGYEDDDGCPDVVPRDLEAITGVIRGVDFDLNKDTLRESSLPILDRVAAVMRKYPTTRFLIGGHIAGPPGPLYGKDISTRRAHSVKRYLVEQGVAEERLEAHGALWDEPIDTNKTAAGRARNRRIELMLLVPDALIEHRNARRASDRGAFAQPESADQRAVIRPEPPSG